MHVDDRKENPLLDRVEINFSIRHEGKKTPSRSEIIGLLAQTEPGAKRDQIVVKNVDTRFGQALTTGVAHIYGSKEAMTVEAPYILERHSEKEEEKEEASAPVESGDDDGGEE